MSTDPWERILATFEGRDVAYRKLDKHVLLLMFYIKLFCIVLDKMS